MDGVYCVSLKQIFVRRVSNVTAARCSRNFLQVLLDELQREQDDFMKNLGH